MRFGTLDFPALMCDSLVFILHWGEEHLVTQEGGMPGAEGEGGGEEGREGEGGEGEGGEGGGTH